MKSLACLLFFLISLTAYSATEPVLTVSDGKVTKTYTREELLKRPDLEKIKINEDVAYANTPREYQAVKLFVLFKNFTIDDGAMIQFKTTDNFSSAIPKSRLLNQSPMQSIAYLAIEPAKDPWPPTGANKHSAGPFYLIWSHPELSKIGQEEWPFGLASFTVIESLAKVYPAIMPDPTLPKNDPVNLGFQVFTKQCFVCHTMNGQGDGKIGPDLNKPMNPTAYFKDNALKSLIRDPKSVRSWPAQIMPGFSQAELNDEGLENLIAYLKHMNMKHGEASSN